MQPGLKVLASIFRELDPLVLTPIMCFIDGAVRAGHTTVTIAIYNCTTKREVLVDIPVDGAPVPVLWVSSGAVTQTLDDAECEFRISGVCADRLVLVETTVVLGVST